MEKFNPMLERIWGNRHSKTVKAYTLWPSNSTCRNPVDGYVIHAYREVHTGMFTVAVFVGPKAWKQPKHPSIGDLPNE